LNIAALAARGKPTCAQSVHLQLATSKLFDVEDRAIMGSTQGGFTTHGSPRPLIQMPGSVYAPDDEPEFEKRVTRAQAELIAAKPNPAPNPMSQPFSSPRRRTALPVALCAILFLAAALKVMTKRPQAQSTAQATSQIKSFEAATRAPRQVMVRPLPVSRTTAYHMWTDADATQPLVIEKIAHNPDEFVRLVEENDRIERR
jgi:hypothetical protein